MLGIVLALGSAAGWGTADFLGGLSTKSLPIWVVGVVSQLAGLVFMGAVVVGWRAGRPTCRSSGWAWPPGCAG